MEVTTIFAKVNGTISSVSVSTRQNFISLSLIIDQNIEIL